MAVRIFNYNTLEKVHTFEAHSDYIRAIAVHPTQPYALTASDDMTIKLWDWDKNWTCKQVRITPDTPLVRSPKAIACPPPPSYIPSLPPPRSSRATPTMS